MGKLTGRAGGAQTASAPRTKYEHSPIGFLRALNKRSGGTNSERVSESEREAEGEREREREREIQVSNA